MKKYQTVIWFVLIAVIFWFFCGMRIGLSANGKDISQAKSKINNFLANSNVAVQSAQYIEPINMYEIVVTGNQIIYLDDKMQNIVIGDVINLASKVNYTDRKLQELERVDFKQLPFNQAIKMVKGDGKVKIAVFTDPDCPFCKKLENDLKKIDNIAVYNFLYPIDSLHPNARKKSIQIWCQPEEKKVNVWMNFMRNNQSIPKVPDCNTPLEKNAQLAESFGIQGTPMIILPDGKRIGGYIPLENFTKILNTYR